MGHGRDRQTIRVSDVTFVADNYDTEGVGGSAGMSTICEPIPGRIATYRVLAGGLALVGSTPLDEAAQAVGSL
jgi:hypothetical protein